jgi:hypothetical protein
LAQRVAGWNGSATFTAPEFDAAVATVERRQAEERARLEAERERERLAAAERHARVAAAENAAKALRCRRGTVVLRGADGPIGEPVEAYVAGGLAHHRSPGARGWSVTHVASGMAATKGEPEPKAVARRIHAALLALGIDWTSAMPARAELARALETVRELSS